jgi:hypothetical protein
VTPVSATVIEENVSPLSRIRQVSLEEGNAQFWVIGKSLLNYTRVD